MYIPKNIKELYLIAKLAINHADGRKIVLWGESKELRSVLKSYFNIEIAFVLTILSETVNGTTIRELKVLDGRSEEFYLIAWERNFELKYDILLKNYGYIETKDYIYRKIKPIVLENIDLSKSNYHDMYGNIIEGTSGIIRKIVFRGYNNYVNLGINIINLENVEFDMSANGEIIVRNNVQFNSKTFFKLMGFNGMSQIFIDQKCRFLKCKFILYNHIDCSHIVINELCTFEENMEIHANSGKKIIIGTDCMFSHDILLQAGNGHSIFDVSKGENINKIYKREREENSKIVIGDHVWVSARTMLIHGTDIGSGSIIGGNSTVKGIFLNNCIIAGNPAKHVKSNIAWSRENGAEDIHKCGKKQNIMCTNNAKSPISGKNVLVVGGTNYMGVQLVKELLARGNYVTVATRGNKKDYFGRSIDRIYIDLENKESVQNVLVNKFFDVVFDNLAYCSNYVKNILDAVKCNQYIQVSSVEVYKFSGINLKEENFDPCLEEQKWCDQSVGYTEGKRQAEIAVYQKYKHINSITVRIPYVTNTMYLSYYCESIFYGRPMYIDDVHQGVTFAQDFEMGKFLTWIAAQEFKGPINFASIGMITISEIIKYVENKMGKKAIIDTKNGSKNPFHANYEKTFSMSMLKAEQLGYFPSELNDWFWNLLDYCIDIVIQEENRKTLFQNNNFNINCIDKSKCTACGACLNICPRDAIYMRIDEEGFSEPQIETEKCINCNLCKTVCPTILTNQNLKENISCYALMAEDTVRLLSSSGGAFSLLARKVLELGGVIWGAAWTEDYSVSHIMIEEINQLHLLRGSKYVQSDTRLSYRETKRILESGRIVLYTGMPCQIEGLLNYLQVDFENLITIDLLCRGIASNKQFKRFIQENYKINKIKEISFKDKQPLGWGATTSYKFEDGTVEKTNIYNSIWMFTYLENVMDRKSCYQCKFNQTKRIGDISIGDFWGIEKYNKSYNDLKGTSIVITSSIKGEKLVQSIEPECKLMDKIPISNAIPYNSALSNHVNLTDKRDRFFDTLRKMPFAAAIDRITYGEKYDVGIVGWWYNLNYGGTLTYYALHEVIRSMGFSVLMIRKSSSGPIMLNENTIPLRFAKKHYKISRLYTTRDMHWINYSCHAFVSGSDQLWNPYLEQYAGKEFFLSFVNQHNLKISYASSFGNIDSIPKNFREKYKPYLDRLDAISVREDYAVDICKNELDFIPTRVCDPIFLCTKKIYYKLALESKLELPRQYLLKFILDPNENILNGCKFVQKLLSINDYVNFTDLQDVSERAKKFCGENVLGNGEIEDFIKAFYYAEFIVTDSFHGTCMAIIFNKPFIAIANKKRGEKRFISLLKWLNLSHKLIDDIDEIYKNSEIISYIDYENVNKIIADAKEKGYQWLYTNLQKMV